MTPDFKVGRKTLKVEIGEHVVEIKKATLGQIETMQEKLNALPEDQKHKSLGIMKSFLLELGVPQAAIDDLDSESFQDLCEFLSGAKKK